MISPFINKSQPSISPAGSYLHSTSFSSPLSLQSMASTFNLAAAPLLILLFTAFSSLPLHALNIGLNAHAGLDLFKQCSRTCESMFCEAPPFLRYGKYCGLLYSGCPGEQPCDRLDACCMHHDQCISKMGNDYLSQKCNKEFLNCVEAFKRSGAPSFRGNTCQVEDVVKSINNAMRAAIVAGKVFGKP